ncbi:MAG: DEAD/DEAH box helicase [Geminicoccaceae bacterium]|nr:DEAD/DEAH box helicase [Geminicoccaceae bacterium]
MTTEQATITFAELGLREEIQRAIADAGYVHPTPIQAAAIPAVLDGRDVVGIAQTGTGKTAGFTLPMLHRLAAGRARARMPRSLILSPTRELATQISQSFETYGKHLNLTMALLIGGVGMGEQEKLLEKGVDVLIATPGRLLDWFDRGRILLNGVEVFVIDEADRMLDMGFIPDVERIFQLLTKRGQTLLFSATMPKEVRRLAERFLRDPAEIEVARPSTRAEKVIDVVVPIRGIERRVALDRLLEVEKIENAIIFCNRKRDVSSVNKFLQRQGRNAQDIHGDLDQSQRQATLDAFKAGTVDFLVATDVAARGLDIVDLPVVINLDVPIHPDDYVHRIGRTGRAGKEGHAYTLADPDDAKYLAAIERLLGSKLERKLIESLSDAAEAPRRPSRARPARRAPEREAEAVSAEAAPAPAAAAESDAAPAPRRRKRRSAPEAAPEASAAAVPSPTEAAATEAGPIEAELTEAAPAEPAGTRRRRRRPETAEVAAEPVAVEATAETPAAGDTPEAEAEPAKSRPRRRKAAADAPPTGVAKAAAPASKPERGRGEPRDEPVVGLGDHVPAFLLRPVPIKAVA